MSLDNSDNYVILDSDPVNPVLEVVILPKSDMHLYQSSLNETHAGKNCKPCLKDAPMSLKKWKDKFFLVDRRGTPIAMAWRHHDASVADPFPKPSEYNEQDAARLREIAIPLHKPYNSLLYVAGLSLVWKEAGHVPILMGPKREVLTMAEFLRLPDLYGCKIVVKALLPPGAALETHHSTPATRLEDIPPKTGNMETTKVACRKVLADKENKKRKTEAKAAAKADGNDDVHHEEVVSKKRAGGVGTPRKKSKTHIGTPPVEAGSEQVSSPTPINHSFPVVALVNEQHVSEIASAARLAALQNQTDKQGSPLDLVNKNVEEPVMGEERGNDHDDVNVAIEGHSDSADGLSGLRTQPSPNDRSGPHIESMKKPMRDKTLLDAEESYSTGRFGNLPFTPNGDLPILAIWRIHENAET
ncbi:hypothetical protein Tco_0348172 [Tanacetum coccineum]